MRTRDGKSRQFGFVGFRSEKEAAEALKFFNGSFMDTYRITCEIARKVGDPEVSRPWSRHSLKKQEKSTVEKRVSVSFVSSSRKVTAEVKNNTENGDLQFQEFLPVMQPRTKSKLWSNDLLEANPSGDQGKDSNKQLQVEGEGKRKSYSKSAKLDETSDKPDGISDNEAAERASSVEHNKSVSDIDYFRSRVKKDWSDTDTDDDVNGDVEEVENDDDNLKKRIDIPGIQKGQGKGQLDFPETDAEVTVEGGSTEKPGDTDDIDEPS